MKKLVSLTLLVLLFSSFNNPPQFDNCYDYAVYSAAMEAIEYGDFETEADQIEAQNWYANECGNSLNNSITPAYIGGN